MFCFDTVGLFEPMNARTDMMQGDAYFIMQVLLLGYGDITHRCDQRGARIIQIEDFEAIQPGHCAMPRVVTGQHPQHAVNPSGARSKRLCTAWHSGHSWYFEKSIRKLPLRGL